jgi:D-2-hydroxyacid dehydrogenase (NADP+)
VTDSAVGTRDGVDMLPAKDKLNICFAHPAYQMAERFAARGTGIAHFQVWKPDDYVQRVAEADVVVASMMWKNDLVPKAKRLKFIQSISAGIDQYDRELLRANGIRLANAAGVNANAVAEHGIAMLLAIKRHIHTGRDNQTRKFWRGMISDIPAREDELGGKTLLIIGLGRIGARLARLAKAFDLKVIATRRDPSRGVEGADEIYGIDRLHELLPAADIVALTCPLTPETTNLIDAKALALMKPTATLINVARGRVVDEDALIRALQEKQIAAAGLDVTREEPLPASSPLWAIPNVLITPHTAGETQRYEDGVVDLLLENLERLWRGETTLRNQIV